LVEFVLTKKVTQYSEWHNYSNT